MLLNILLVSAAITTILTKEVQSIEFSKLTQCPKKYKSIKIENQGFICLNEISHCSDHSQCLNDQQCSDVFGLITDARFKICVDTAQIIKRSFNQTCLTYEMCQSNICSNQGLCVKQGVIERRILQPSQQPRPSQGNPPSQPGGGNQPPGQSSNNPPTQGNPNNPPSPGATAINQQLPRPSVPAPPQTPSVLCMTTNKTLSMALSSTCPSYNYAQYCKSQNYYYYSGTFTCPEPVNLTFPTIPCAYNYYTYNIAAGQICSIDYSLSYSSTRFSSNAPTLIVIIVVPAVSAIVLIIIVRRIILKRRQDQQNKVHGFNNLTQDTIMNTSTIMPPTHPNMMMGGQPPPHMAMMHPTMMMAPTPPPMMMGPPIMMGPPQMMGPPPMMMGPPSMMMGQPGMMQMPQQQLPMMVNIATK